MSRQLINRSDDLFRLEADGYEISICSGYLVVNNIPYVDSNSNVQYGQLVCELDLSGDKTVKPRSHVALFAGDHPCDKQGKKLKVLEHSSNNLQLPNGIQVKWSFSCKPTSGYDNYYHKISTYSNMISVHAQQLDSSASARTFQVIEVDDDESPFKYVDNASSRAGIVEDVHKLELSKVAIIGLGGTGSYVLDLVAKTPVKEIHLFDDDWFLQHNAFRSPGAASAEELRMRKLKVEYVSETYSAMRRGIIPHAYNIDDSNVSQLGDFDFVFLCIDDSLVKEKMIKNFISYCVPFIDTGMGIEKSIDGLRGILRVTSGTSTQNEFIWEKNRIPFSRGNENDLYSTNIQVADLNAMNAILAVIKWKKLFGFYADLENEHFTTYTVDGNFITNEDKE